MATLQAKNIRLKIGNEVAGVPSGAAAVNMKKQKWACGKRRRENQLYCLHVALSPEDDRGKKSQRKVL